MKPVILLAVALLCGAWCDNAELWEVRFLLMVPRVFDNTQSKGYRKYEIEQVRGFFKVWPDTACGEPAIEFVSLENLKHKVNGKPVTYDCIVENPQWHGIGSNRTCQFNTRSVNFQLIAEPSYAIGTEPTEDNSLILTVAALGTERLLQGYAAGQQGCGCAEYGHTSPTRIWKTNTVRDTAAVYGQFRARRVFY